MTRDVQGGVYVLRYSKKTVKIGMGINIEKRLKQYRGYHRHGKDYPRLLVIKSKYPRQLEKIIHQAVSKKYARIGRLEIFICREHNEIVRLIKKTVKNDRHLVNLIVE